MKAVAQIRENGVVMYTVTAGAHSVLHGRFEDKVLPWTRAVWSMGRTLSVECGEWVTHVMVDVVGGQMALKSVAEEVEKVKARNGAEIALRGRKRYVSEVRRVGRAREEQRDASVWLREMVVVTGGFGGLGKAFASQISHKHGNDGVGLVLMGRNGPSESDRSERFWGGRASVVCAVASVEQMEGCVVAMQGGRKWLGKSVSGVLHMAGVVRDGLLSNLTWDAVAAVLVPKVAGLHAMRRAVTEANVGWMLFSSTTSMLGNVGQGNYGAANGFLDGVARQKSGNGMVSVNWGAWAVGMYARAAATARLSMEETKTMGVEETVALVELAWTSGKAEVGVARMDWARDAFLTRKLAKGRGAVRRAARATTERLSEEDVVEMVDRAMKSVLGMSEGTQLDETSPLRDLGFDSMLSVELRDRLSEQLGLQLSATILFDYPTLKALRKKIVELVHEVEGRVDTGRQSSKELAWASGGTRALM